jgi:arylsulfatase A-like enzyme
MARRLGTQSNVIYWDTPWGISLKEKFLPEVLQEEGYKTAMFGKWHCKEQLLCSVLGR